MDRVRGSSIGSNSRNDGAGLRIDDVNLREPLLVSVIDGENHVELDCVESPEPARGMNSTKKIFASNDSAFWNSYRSTCERAFDQCLTSSPEYCAGGLTTRAEEAIAMENKNRTRAT